MFKQPRFPLISKLKFVHLMNCKALRIPWKVLNATGGGGGRRLTLRKIRPLSHFNKYIPMYSISLKSGNPIRNTNESKVEAEIPCGPFVLGTNRPNFTTQFV